MRLLMLANGFETRTQKLASADAGGVVSVAEVAPVSGLDTSPLSPMNHWYPNGPGPVAATESATVPPAGLLASAGSSTIVGCRSRIRLWLPWAATSATCVATFTGVLRLEVEPSPSCPLPLLPAAHRDRSWVMNRLCELPAATRVTDAAITTGVDRAVVVPSPSRPEELEPIACSMPFAVTNRLWLSPAVASITEEAMRTGTCRLVVVPSPRRPEPLFPIAHREPSALTNQL